jgi:hypothetical protein
MGKQCSSCGDEILEPKLPDDEPEECENCAPPSEEGEGGMGMGMGLDEDQDDM